MATKQGATALDLLKCLNSQVGKLADESNEHRARFQKPEAKQGKHEMAFQALVDVRERALLTWLRDQWRDHDAGNKNPPEIVQPLKPGIEFKSLIDRLFMAATQPSMQ